MTWFCSLSHAVTYLYCTAPSLRRNFIVTVDVAARWPSGTPQGRPLLPSTTLLQPGDPDTSPVRHIIMSRLVFDSKIHSRTVPIQNIVLTRGGKKHVSLLSIGWTGSYRIPHWQSDARTCFNLQRAALRLSTRVFTLVLVPRTCAGRELLSEWRSREDLAWRCLEQRPMQCARTR